MKDLEEFARAKKAGCEFEYQDFNHIWTPLNYPSWNAVLLDEALEDGKIRIKPNKTYYRVYLDDIDERGNPRTVGRDTPYTDATSATAAAVHDFEIEQPVPDNETIKLYEFVCKDLGDIEWDISSENHSSGWELTGRTITAVIKGESHE